MAVHGLNHFNLRADREVLDGLRDFYVNVVGLQPGPRPPLRSFGYWLYAGDDPILHLSLASPDEGRLPHGVNTFDHVALACTDCDATEAHLVHLDIAYTRRRVPMLGQIQLFFRDPAGNGVELNFAGSGLDPDEDNRYT